MKTPAILLKQFPPHKFDVTEEFNGKSARNIFSDPGAARMGARKIGETGYTVLCQMTFDETGGKTQVIICKNALLGDLLNP